MAVQTTLVLIKPDAVQRGLVGEIISRFEAKGLTLAGMRLIQASKQIAEQHYAVHSERPFFKDLIAFITGGPLVAIALRGDEAIAVVRTLMGATNGREAAPGTIRGDYGISVGANLAHGSDSEDTAASELELWFPNGEGLVDWQRCIAPWLDA